jgi:peptide/nickel transport system permease protein
LFAVALGWFPSSGRTTPGAGGFFDHLQHLVLPTLVLACVQAAGWSRYLRGSMIDALAQPTVITARARGVPETRVVMSHAFQNALGPFVAVVTIDAALLISGAVVTESVFAWPGLGSLFTEALARRDYAVLMTLLVLSSTAVIVLNVVADVAQALIDPRVTVE